MLYLFTILCVWVIFAWLYIYVLYIHNGHGREEVLDVQELEI